MSLQSQLPDVLLEKAHFMHEKGYNCAETVLWTLASLWHLDCPISYATGLGGGVSRSGETCGALTGAVLALGAKVGRIDPDDQEKKLDCYRLGQEIIKEFKAKMGTTQCSEIIGSVPGSEGASPKNAAGGLRTEKCKDAIEVAIRAAARVMESTS